MFWKLINLKKVKKATSLVEVLIILAIISTTIVASTTLAVNSQRAVLENQREDTANGVLVQALEVAKSPVDIKLGSQVDFLPLNTYSFRFTRDSRTGDLVLAEVPRQQLTTCSEGSIFQVETFFAQDEIEFPLCLAVEVEMIDPPGREAESYFEITTRVVYQQGDETRFFSLVGFRNEAFTI